MRKSELQPRSRKTPTGGRRMAKLKRGQDRDEKFIRGGYGQNLQR